MSTILQMYLFQPEHQHNALTHTIKKNLNLQTLVVKQDHVLWQAGLLTCQAAICIADLDICSSIYFQLLTGRYTKFYLTYFCQC